MSLPINPEDVIQIIQEQRNAALNEVARLGAAVIALQKQIQELKCAS